MALYNNNVLFQLPFLLLRWEDAVLAAATGRQRHPKSTDQKRVYERADDERYRPVQANTDQSFRSLRPPKKSVQFIKQ